MQRGSPDAGVATTRPPGIDRASERRRRHRFWLVELVLVAFGYWLYTLIRNGVTTQESEAVGRAEKLVRLERSLHLYHEQAINCFVAAHHWLAYLCDYYYATLHFVVTIGVGIWVLVRHPRYARGLRTAWYATNCLALLGFAFFALAPPRLLPGGGFVDTVVEFHTWGSWGDASVAAHSNQYAAMPSMHIGWALWVSIVVVKLARHRWSRVLGVVYPSATLFVIVGTGNHYYLDAVGGAVALAGGFLIARVFHGGPIIPAAGQRPVLPPLAGQRSAPPPPAAELAPEQPEQPAEEARTAPFQAKGTSPPAA